MGLGVMVSHVSKKCHLLFKWPLTKEKCNNWDENYLYSHLKGEVHNGDKYAIIGGLAGLSAIFASLIVIVLTSKNIFIFFTGVNFNSNLRATFLYAYVLHICYVLKVWVCNFLSKGNWPKDAC